MPTVTGGVLSFFGASSAWPSAWGVNSSNAPLATAMAKPEAELCRKSRRLNRVESSLFIPPVVCPAAVAANQVGYSIGEKSRRVKFICFAPGKSTLPKRRSRRKMRHAIGY